MPNNALKLVEDIGLSSFDLIEGSEFGPIDFNEIIENPTRQTISYRAVRKDGGELPDGLVFDDAGLFYGKPAIGTARDEPYFIVVKAKTESLPVLEFEAKLLVLTPEAYREKTRLEAEVFRREIAPDLYELEKYWENFSKELSLPSLEEILNRNITPAEWEYLFQRFASLTVWNADTIAPADTGELIYLRDAAHYRVYDFGVALVATPSELYDSRRTFSDSLQTARALAHEAVRRGWNIRLEGHEKMVTAAWVEVQRINSLRKTSEEKVQVFYDPTVSEKAILNYLGM